MHVDAEILGLGYYTPPNVLTNQRLEELVDTDNDWIIERTGIVSRNIVDGYGNPATGGAIAGERAIRHSGLAREDIEQVIVATNTNPLMFPSVASQVQYLMNIPNSSAYDLQMTCSAYVQALEIAANSGKATLVGGFDTLSFFTDYTDRSICTLFGDGFGAAVVAPGRRGILGTHSKSKPELGGLLYCPSGLSNQVISDDPLTFSSEKVTVRPYIAMDGRKVFKNAVLAMSEEARTILDITGLEIEDIQRVFPHQANARIIRAAAEKAGIPMDKVDISVENSGNTSTASTITAFTKAYDSGRIEPSGPSMMVVFGGGFTQASAIVDMLGKNPRCGVVKEVPDSKVKENWERWHEMYGGALPETEEDFSRNLSNHFNEFRSKRRDICYLDEPGAETDGVMTEEELEREAAFRSVGDQLFRKVMLSLDQLNKFRVRKNKLPVSLSEFVLSSSH